MKKDIPKYKKFITPYLDKIKGAGTKLHGDFIMNVRVSMLKDIERLKLKSNVLGNCVLVYSCWNGYKIDEPYKSFLDRISELEIDIIDQHVSGHADYIAIKQVIDVVDPEAVIPIHTENKDRIKEYTDKAVILEDMEVYKIKKKGWNLWKKKK